MRIPLSVPSYGQAEIAEALESMESTWLTMGKKVARFEAMFAEYIGVKHGIMVNSGSSANLLALSALGLKPGGEVITPALTWATTVWPIFQVGAVPVLVDVDPETFNIDPDLIRAAITDKTAVIMPVHLLGNPCDDFEIRHLAHDHGLDIVEDACEAPGAEREGERAGSWGNMATFSFFFSHHISTIEGGMVMTNEDELAAKLLAMRAFGWVRGSTVTHPDIDPRFLFTSLGYNMRPTELQGAFGIHQLPRLEAFIAARRDNAAWLTKALTPYTQYLDLPMEQPGTRHVWFFYSVVVKPNAPFTRDQLKDYLEVKGLETRPVMAGNITHQPAMQGQNYRVSGKLTHTQTIHRRGLCFGCHQGIGPDERKAIESYFRGFFDEYTR